MHMFHEILNDLPNTLRHKRREKTMMNCKKYTRQYFMPPERCMDWADKEYVDHAPVWCSVDLRDGNQAFGCAYDTSAEAGLFPDAGQDWIQGDRGWVSGSI